MNWVTTDVISKDKEISVLEKKYSVSTTKKGFEWIML